MRVYHFLSEQFGMDDLLKKRLKIATLNDLNDPFELFAVSLSHRWRERAWTQSTGTQLNGQSRLWRVNTLSRASVGCRQHFVFRAARFRFQSTRSLVHINCTWYGELRESR